MPLGSDLSTARSPNGPRTRVGVRDTARAPTASGGRLPLRARCHPREQKPPCTESGRGITAKTLNWAPRVGGSFLQVVLESGGVVSSGNPARRALFLIALVKRARYGLVLS